MNLFGLLGVLFVRLLLNAFRNWDCWLDAGVLVVNVGLAGSFWSSAGATAYSHGRYFSLGCGPVNFSGGRLRCLLAVLQGFFAGLAGLGLWLLGYLVQLLLGFMQSTFCLGWHSLLLDGGDSGLLGFDVDLIWLVLLLADLHAIE